tara:strand:+ start:1545 stop:1907 length:363 start_codon:yes stop_codon:yes gene_type:complete
MVKGYKIDLKGYPVTILKLDEATKEVKEVEDTFKVKESLGQILFMPELKLSIDDAFEHKTLADKIRGTKGDHVILDQSEMDKINKALSLVKSPAENQLEFYRRLKEPEDVELVEEKPKDK